METPARITFRDIEPSDFIERRVREEVDKLERYYGRLTTAHVTIGAPHRRHGKGTTYRISLNLSAPTGNVVVNRDPGVDHAHEAIYVAIRDAFRAARRQLEDRVRERREQSHGEGQPHHTGRVAQLFSEDGYGFIEAADGTSFYFHEDNVSKHGFDRLRAGAEVRFVEVPGKSGPRASAVMPV